jgi:preprotein translocase subunit SecE
MTDKIKLVLAGLLVIAGLAGFYLLADKPTVVRVLAVMGGVLAGFAVAWFSAPGREFAGFAKESVNEAKRVVWPTRKEATQTTAIVFVFVVIMAVFVFLVDTSLAALVRMLMNRGS